MDDREFERLSGAVLERIESLLEAKDIDFEFQPGGVIEVDNAEGGKIIINRHLPSHEIWLAGRKGAFHFHHDGASWRDTRDGEELMARLLHLLGV